jgi:molybdopterin adenylyltransferase
MLAILTFSDTRTEENDEGGRLVRELLEAAGHVIVRSAIVRENLESVNAALDDVLADPRPAALVTTGGTGIAARDIAIDCVEKRLEKRLDGFGEAFRRLSWDEVGARSMLSRAVAGVAGGKLVACLPGSIKAVRLGMTALVLPMLPHAVDLLSGKTGHK